MIRQIFFSALCLFVLLLARTNFTNNIFFDELYIKTNDFHFDASSVTSETRNSSTAPIVDVKRTFPTSVPRSNLTSTTLSLCTRDEIKRGAWHPKILDSPPYLPSTVHLRCYPESEYKTGKWVHTYEWRPASSSLGKCSFPDWNRGDFCRLMRRSTVLVRLECILQISWSSNDMLTFSPTDYWRLS